MRTQITRGDVFVSKLLSGVLHRETLPNHAVTYHGFRELADKQRFIQFLRSPGAMLVFETLDEKYDPDSCESLFLEA